MSSEEVENGKEWIAQALTQYASQTKIVIDGVEWGKGDGDFERGCLTLGFFVDDERKTIKFDVADLEDVPSDRSVQSKLEKFLKKMLRSF